MRKQHFAVLPLVLLCGMLACTARGDASIDLARLVQAATRDRNPAAQVLLGKCYLDGKIMPQNKELAADLFYYATVQGEAKGLKELEKMADKGDPKAQFYLGACYTAGRGMDQDLELGIKWWSKAAKNNQVQAQYLLADYYYRLKDEHKKNMKQAVKWFKRAANNDHDEAQHQLATLYFNGEGVSRNHRDAVHWWFKAADRQHAAAQYHLGVCFAEGHGNLVKSLPDAIKWWRQAAHNGDVEALYEIGRRYVEGDGIAKDLVAGAAFLGDAARKQHLQAFEALRELASENQADAQYIIGLFHQQGIMTVNNETEAVQWLARSAAQGYAKAFERLRVMNHHADAQTATGLCYLKGVATKRNTLRAFYTLKHAVELGSGEAVPWMLKAAEDRPDEQLIVGSLLMEGTLLKKDVTQAVNWYRKAAMNGHSEAQYRLARCYETGVGCEADQDQALRWYRKSAERGHPHARQKVKLAQRAKQEELPDAAPLGGYGKAPWGSDPATVRSVSPGSLKDLFRISKASSEFSDMAQWAGMDELIELIRYSPGEIQCLRCSGQGKIYHYYFLDNRLFMATYQPAANVDATAILQVMQQKYGQGDEQAGLLTWRNENGEARLVHGGQGDDVHSILYIDTSRHDEIAQRVKQLLDTKAETKTAAPVQSIARDL